jgi:hypothetical protein
MADKEREFTPFRVWTSPVDSAPVRSTGLRLRLGLGLAQETV